MRASAAERRAGLAEPEQRFMNDTLEASKVHDCRHALITCGKWCGCTVPRPDHTEWQGCLKAHLLDGCARIDGAVLMAVWVVVISWLWQIPCFPYLGSLRQQLNAHDTSNIMLLVHIPVTHMQQQCFSQMGEGYASCTSATKRLPGMNMQENTLKCACSRQAGLCHWHATSDICCML